MKKLVNISSIVFAFACYNNASGMLVKYIKPQQPRIMQQKRILCTVSQHQVRSNPNSSIFQNGKSIELVAPTQIKNRYILSEHRATSEVPQLSEKTYQQLQKLFDRNNEQNIAIWHYTFYGKKLDIEKLSELEGLVQNVDSE